VFTLASQEWQAFSERTTHGQWSKASGTGQGREWRIKLQRGDGRLFRVLNPC